MKLKCKDEICAYFTYSNEITDFMVNSLDIRSSDLILEPSAGDGVFVDSILEINKFCTIEAVDYNESAFNILKSKYNEISNVKIRQTDTLLDDEFDYVSLLGGKYDKIIGNPPYGAWQDYEKRKILKRKYSQFYVKETYTLFLLRCISLLKYGGKLAFIIPDTFLYLNLHKELRKYVLSNAKIKQILIFPSKFFPGVSFGYSNLSIIVLERSKKNEALDNRIEIIKNIKKPKDLYKIGNKRHKNEFEVYYLSQKEVYNNEKSNFILANDKIKNIIQQTTQTLGDYADIVTGFYCGNNKKYIRTKNENIKRAKGYEIIDLKKIYKCKSLAGINVSDDGYIEYIKSSPERKYLRNHTEWYIRWDKTAIQEYNDNPKARFQNSKYYFKNGVAVPMVKSTQIKASLINNNLFDQSIVGIFPSDKKYLHYILALMNSDLVNKMIHVINPTANNSANYLKRIPFIKPTSKDLLSINALVEEIFKLSEFEYDKIDFINIKIQNIINNIYGYN